MKNIIPCEIVFHPDWWNRHYGIVFNENYFFDPQTRVEVDREVRRLIAAAGPKDKIAVCCINMDADVPDENVIQLFNSVTQD